MRIIGIVSGKGGVGKTTVSSNLAHSLAMLGKNVLLVDANVTTSHLGLSLGIVDSPVTLNDLLKGKKLSSKSDFIEYRPGFYILTSDIMPEKLKGVKISNLKNVVARIAKKFPEFDFIILDSAPGLGKEAQAVFDASDELLFVTTPLVPSASDILRVSEFVSKNKKLDRLGLVLNMVRNKPYELTKLEIENFTGINVLGTIPYDKKIKMSLTLRKNVVEEYPTSKASREIINIGKKLLGIEPVKKVGLIEKLKQKIKEFYLLD